MCFAQGPQRSDAGEARNPQPFCLNQALYHWATALPMPGKIAVSLASLIYKLPLFPYVVSSYKYQIQSPYYALNHIYVCLQIFFL